MRRTILTSLAAAGALAVVPAVASAGPEVFATAKDGSMRSMSAVLVGRGTVDLIGGWLDTGLPCQTGRRLRIVADIYRIRRPGVVRHVHLVTEKVRANCAEGGPNAGFHVAAKNRHLACPDGSWKPGRYEFRTRTTILASGLVSDVDLGWRKTKRC